MKPRGLNARCWSPFLGILLAAALTVPSAAPLQVLRASAQEGPLLTVINVCETGGSLLTLQAPLLFVQGGAPCRLPDLGPVPVQARDKVFTAILPDLSIDRPPKRG